MTIRVDAKGKVFTDIIRKDEVPALVQTLTNLVHGNLYLRPDQRFKDEMNQGQDKFIAVTNATVYAGDGSVLCHSQFLTLNKAHIVWIRPDEEADDENAPADAPETGE